jgi:NitT/TauT family transport system substrate-binding protein
MRHDPASSPLLNRKLRPTRNLLVFGAAAGAAMLLAAGCSTGGSGTGAVSGTITIAAAPGVDDAPLYLAQQKGLFAAAGLHVVIKNFGTDSQELAAVESGSAQIAASDYGNIFTAQEKTGNLRLLADGYDAGPGSAEILSLPKYNFTNALALRNSPIGLPSDSISSTAAGVSASLYVAAAREVMSDFMASGADILTWTRMSQPQEIAELQSGSLKAALLTQPYIYQAESSLGATPVLDAFSGGTAGLPISGYVATSAWVKGNAQAVTDFQSAIEQAQSDASMTGTIQQALSKLTGFTSLDADMVNVGTYPTATSVGELQRVTELMTREAMLSRSTPVGIQQMLVSPGSG